MKNIIVKMIFNWLFLIGLSYASTPLLSELKQCPNLNMSSYLAKIVAANDLVKLGVSTTVINVKGNIVCEDHFQEKEMIYPASSIKTLIAMSTLEMADKGEIDLKQKITIDRANANDECHLYDCSIYGRGKVVTISKLLSDMMVASNNIATNQLLQINSKERINLLAKRLGIDIIIYRGLYSIVNPEPEIKERNQATSEALVSLYHEVATGKKKILSEEGRQFLLELLKSQTFANHLNYYFPKEVVFYHKAGTTSNSSSDAGFFYLNEEQIVLVSVLQNFYNPKTLQQIGRYILNNFKE